MNTIKQERLETQNVIILWYWQIYEVDMLKEEAQREEAADKQAQIKESSQSLLTNGNPQAQIKEQIKESSQGLPTNGNPQAAIMSPQAAIMPPQAAAMPPQAAIMPPQAAIMP